MDLTDKIIVGFLACWVLLLLAVVARSIHDRKAIPPRVFLPWLNLLFMSLFWLVAHHPQFRQTHGVVAGLLLLGWGGCAISIFGLARRH